jgi:hypothetical protein
MPWNALSGKLIQLCKPIKKPPPSMDLEKYSKWEQLPVSSIISIMVRWLDFHNVEFHVKQRNNVETGIWYEITVRDADHNYLWVVESQSIELLKARLIKKLDSLNLRSPEFIPRKEEE